MCKMETDVDCDFDGKLLDQFRSMGTTDKDVLIAEFQAVLGNNVNPESCAFFLDMNNWNLQNAVCSYYDFEQPAITVPFMTLMGDVTVGEGEAVAPNTTFVKTWKIKNSGADRWPPGCSLHFCRGDNLSSQDRKMVAALAPGESVDASLEMRSPSGPGSYSSLWRMCSPTGVYFGDVINVEVSVAEGGLLGLTQQLSRIGDFQPPPMQVIQIGSYTPHGQAPQGTPDGTCVQAPPQGVDQQMFIQDSTNSSSNLPNTRVEEDADMS